MLPHPSKEIRNPQTQPPQLRNIPDHDSTLAIPSAKRITPHGPQIPSIAHHATKARLPSARALDLPGVAPSGSIPALRTTGILHQYQKRRTSDSAREPKKVKDNSLYPYHHVPRVEEAPQYNIAVGRGAQKGPEPPKRLPRPAHYILQQSVSAVLDGDDRAAPGVRLAPVCGGRVRQRNVRGVVQPMELEGETWADRYMWRGG
ncbi:hypothetical protein CC86DRAFT_405941 [Ophiobolus disseminans]|uniref:Uncharacterized protein n=1 Tax=Ophiobolus disseminans TaxID=1469910 RepID=A0A6A7A1U6_9PLEO|nr:hypothetical protein CC86DRAFT_405941 [Ophiobolus disseminans]